MPDRDNEKENENGKEGQSYPFLEHKSKTPEGGYTKVIVRADFFARILAAVPAAWMVVSEIIRPKVNDKIEDSLKQEVKALEDLRSTLSGKGGTKEEESTERYLNLRFENLERDVREIKSILFSEVKRK
jgi:hypothetical protein